MKLQYTANKVEDQNYHKLYLRVFPADRIWADRESEIELSWQSNSDDPNDWYGGAIDLSVTSIKQLSELTKLARRIVNDDTNWTRDPHVVLDGLDRKKAVEVKYDSRESAFRELDQVVDPSLQRWLDKPIGQAKYSKYAVIASDEDDARKKILAQAAEDGMLDWVAEWSGYNMPVWSPSYGNKGPDLTPARELVGQPQEIEVEV